MKKIFLELMKDSELNQPTPKEVYSQIDKEEKLESDDIEILRWLVKNWIPSTFDWERVRAEVLLKKLNFGGDFHRA